MEMVVCQCYRQPSCVAVEGGRPALSSRCLSRSNGFFFSRLHMSDATRPSSTLHASSASPSQTEPARPLEPTSTAKISSRRTSPEATVDRDGYLCSPRAARELALSILYAALISGDKPMRLFRARLKQQSGYLGKDRLASYKHEPDVGGSIMAEDASSAKKLEDEQLEKSMLDTAVLSAPPSKVYNKSILMMAQDIIKVTADSWSEHDIILSGLIPNTWKKGGHAAVQQCILHMSMAEMAIRGTPPKVVINEAVELGQRFMDMRSARVINGCLGKFIESTYYKDSQMPLDGVSKTD